ncbi:Crp/Fnr family transcriptional regulator [Paenibacillus campi]|uniref:Crp/Fnr family transcriptional regulator n=1 Tax=Paenibacillus campi TaxID=3106031 RepID=UPI002AFF17BD|nr:Crp/Fnr family transcriptional regulator [Paenibacillus sp. SGZ-1014]
MLNSVADTSFFAGVANETNREEIESGFLLRKYPRGQVLYEYGDQGDSMYIVKSGSLKIYRTDDRSEIILGHQFAVEAVGELELFHHDSARTASVATLEASELWVIKRQDMDELVQKYPELMRKVIYILSERLTQADRKIEYLTFLDVRIRVANLLLDLCSNFGVEEQSSLKIDWKFTHQHLSDMIGVTRETVTKTLNEFQQNGWLSFVNRQLTIHSVQALREYAGGPLTAPEATERKWHSIHKYM